MNQFRASSVTHVAQFVIEQIMSCQVNRSEVGLGEGRVSLMNQQIGILNPRQSKQGENIESLNKILQS